MNIQIIVTYNSEDLKIDEALLRKGRLVAKYEFKELSKERAKKLADKIGVDELKIRSSTLADIYNANDESFENKNNSIIGF